MIVKHLLSSLSTLYPLTTNTDSNNSFNTEIPIAISSPLEQISESLSSIPIDSCPSDELTNLSPLATDTNRSHAYINNLLHRIHNTINTKDVYQLACYIHNCIVNKYLSYHPCIELLTKLINQYYNHTNTNITTTTSSLESPYLSLLSIIYLMIQYPPSTIPILVIDIVLKSIITTIIIHHSTQFYNLTLNHIISTKFTILQKLQINLLQVLSYDEQILTYSIIESLSQRKGQYSNEASMIILFLESFHTYNTIDNTLHNNSKNTIDTIRIESLYYSIQRTNQAIIQYIDNFFTITNDNNNNQEQVSNIPSELEISSSIESTTSTVATTSTASISVMTKQKTAMYIVRIALLYKVLCKPYYICYYCLFDSSTTNNDNQKISAKYDNLKAYIPISLAWKLLDASIERQAWDLCRKICLTIFPMVPYPSSCPTCSLAPSASVESRANIQTLQQQINDSDVITQLSALIYVAEAGKLYQQRRVYKEFTSIYEELFTQLTYRNPATSVPSTTSTSLTSIFPSTNTNNASNYIGVFPSSAKSSIAVTSSISHHLSTTNTITSSSTISSHESTLKANGLTRPFDTLPIDQQNKLIDRPTSAALLTKMDLFKGHNKSINSPRSTQSTDDTSGTNTPKSKPTYESIRERQQRTSQKNTPSTTISKEENWREVTPHLLPSELEDRLFNKELHNQQWEASPFMIPRTLTETINKDALHQSSHGPSAAIVKSSLAQQLKIGKDISSIYSTDPPLEYQEQSLSYILNVLHNISLALIYVGTDKELQLLLLQKLLAKHQYQEAKGCLRALFILNNVPIYEVPVMENNTADTITSGESVLTHTKLYNTISFYDINNAETNWIMNGKTETIFPISSKMLTFESSSSTEHLLMSNTNNSSMEKEFTINNTIIPLKEDSHYWTPVYTIHDNDNTYPQHNISLSTSITNSLSIIRTISDLYQFRNELDTIIQSQHTTTFEFLGIDTEWRPNGLYDQSIPSIHVNNTIIHPSMRDLQQSLVNETSNNSSADSAVTETKVTSIHWPTSIIQLSTLSKTWIIDLLSFINQSTDSIQQMQYNNELGLFFQWLFCSTNYFIKIGYKINGDLYRLISSYPFLQPYISNIKPVIDISDLLSLLVMYEQEHVSVSSSESTSASSTRLRRKLPVFSSTTTLTAKQSNISLSTIIQKYLGKPLDKRAKTSDWQIRPLSLLQIIYAGTDAKAVVCLAYSIIERLPFLTLYNHYLYPIIQSIDNSTTKDTSIIDVDNNDFILTENDKKLIKILQENLEWRYIVSSPTIIVEEFSNGQTGTEHDNQTIEEFSLGFHSFLNVKTITTTSTITEKEIISQHSLACLYSTYTNNVSYTNNTTTTIKSPLPSSQITSSSSHNDSLGANDVALALSQAGLDPSIHHLEVTTDATTALNASSSLGILHSAVVKSLAFWNTSNPNNYIPLLFLIAGDCVMDYTKATKLLNIPKKKLKLATAQECITTWGYTPGTFPPLGLRKKIPVYIDQNIQSRAVITPHDTSDIRYLYAGGGSIRHSIRLTWEQLLMVTEGIIGDIATLNPKHNKIVDKDDNKYKDTDINIPLSSLSSVSVEAEKKDIDTFRSAINHQVMTTTTNIPIYVIDRPKFIVDTMLGRVLRWLRVIGVDAETTNGHEAVQWYQQHVSPILTTSVTASNPSTLPSVSLDHSQMIKWANETNRIILTRDRKLLNRKEYNLVTYFILSNDTPSQFDEIVNRFGITVRPGDLMSRCAKCNGLGYEHITPDQLRKLKLESPTIYDTPDKVISMVNEFWRCPRCLKIYWEGPKFEETREKYWNLFGNPNEIQENENNDKSDTEE